MLIKAGVKLVIIVLLVLLTTVIVSADLTITRNTIGALGDFDFEFWKESKGEGRMIVYRDGTFDCTWEDADVILFRTGKKLGTTGVRRTSNISGHEELGDIFISYSADYQPDGNSYLCVYGWTKDPLVEFYVIDAWGSWHPTGDDFMGTVTIDGGTYDVYVTMRIEEASIQGTQTFAQFWSVRTDKRTEGMISLSEHFKMWEEMGMELGNMFEIAFCVEGIHSSGEASIDKLLLTIGDVTYGEGTHFTEEKSTGIGISPVIIFSVAIGLLVTGVAVKTIVKKD